MVELMKTFPASPEAQVNLANWRTPPFNKWGFHHVCEIVPSADIPASASECQRLETDDYDLNDLMVPDVSQGGLSFDAYLQHSHTDGLVILHHGKIIHETYANGMTARTPHILMSVSKSLLGFLAGTLVAKGELKPEQLVTDFVPEVAETAYRDATIRHLLDMRVGIDFDEDYLATSGPIIEYRKSTNWNPLEPGQSPSDLRSFYRSLVERNGPHNGPINYVSPNCDLLGWVMERASGMRYADLMSERLWSPMGAEENAYITVDRLGAPRCAGGMCTTTRDLARVGQLILQRGTQNGTEIVPATWINDIEGNGDREAWQTGNMEVDFPGLDILYRSQCYSLQGPTPLLFGFGIHGQFLFVDRHNDVVIAKFSSQPLPIDVDQIMLTMNAATAIIEHISDQAS